MIVIQIGMERSEEIAELAVRLTREIIDRTGVPHFDVDLPATIALCRDFMANGQYRVLAAIDDDRVVGFAALCQSHSLYAQGAFGIVQECYVLPEYRCKGVGRQLLDACVRFAGDNGWRRLELCTPPLPEFERSVDFYRENGFKITGGYKMKREIG